MSSSENPVNSSACQPSVSRVVVYKTTGCPKCSMLEEWLRSIKKEFEERDLDDVDIMAELVMRNEVILSAPVLEVGGTLYREDEIFDKDGRINGELSRILEGK